MRNGVCVLLEQLAEKTERTEAPLPLKKLSGGVLAELTGGEASVTCEVRKKRVCANGVHVLD